MSPIVRAQSNKILTSKFLNGISSFKFNFDKFVIILLDKNSLLSNNLFIFESSLISIVSFKNCFKLSDLYNLSNFPSLSETS